MTTFDSRTNTKHIVEDDALDALTDAITDLMLVYGTDDPDDPRLNVAFNNAIGSATNTHYPAEKDGDSDGTRIIIHPSEGDVYALDGGEVPS